MQELGEYKIGTRPFFYPMHQQPVFKKMGYVLDDNLPNSERLYNRGFYIPSGLALTGNQMKEVSDSMQEVLK